MALRIKELLYEDMYTIAGREEADWRTRFAVVEKLKVVGADEDGQPESAPVEFNDGALFPPETPTYTRAVPSRTAEERQGLKQLASELRELLSLLEQETNRNSKS
jgi:hypothetical protein